MAKITVSLELDLNGEQSIETIERIIKSISSSVEIAPPPFDRVAFERDLLEAYASNPQGFEWWERNALHKRVFGRYHYSAAALYRRDLGLIEFRDERYFLSERGRARLEELRSAATTRSSGTISRTAPCG